jgi:biopolymer transport protein TolR
MALEIDHRPGQLWGDINVTPMIDILLVLLIIFMVIAPVLPRGLGAALPQRSTNPNPRGENPIVVQITSAGNGLPSYKINQENVNIDQMGSRLSSILSIRGNKAIFIKADDTLAFSTIAKVMDIGKGAGADRIGLLTSRDAFRN